MWTRILNNTLQNVTQIGRLEVTWPDKSKTTYGNQDSLRAAITLNDPALPRKLVLNPELALGEAYMDGTLTVENDAYLPCWISSHSTPPLWVMADSKIQGPSHAPHGAGYNNAIL